MTHLSLWEMLYFYFFNIFGKESTPSCPNTQANNNWNSHYHPSHFFLLNFPSQYQRFFILLLLPFFIFNNKKCVQRRVTIPQWQCHVSSAQQIKALFGGVRTWMGDQVRIPRVVMTFFLFFLFSPFPFKVILLCNVVSSTCIYHQFVCHFALSAVFTFSLITQVIIEIRVLPSAENGVIFNNYSPKARWIYICYLPGGRSVWEKTVPEVLSTARGRRPRAVLKTKGTVFSHTDRLSPVNNMFVFFPAVNWLYRLKMGLFTQLLSFNGFAHRLPTIGKNLRNERVTQIVDKIKMY